MGSLLRQEVRSWKIEKERNGSGKNEVPIWEKVNLTLNEAASYYGIGVNKLRELTDGDNCKFVLWVGNKRLIKRKAMEEYLMKLYSI